MNNPKGFFDTELQAPSKCHTAIRPTKALNGNVRYRFHFSPSMWIWAELGLSSIQYCFSVHMRWFLVFQRESREVLHGERGTVQNQQKPDKSCSLLLQSFPQHETAASPNPSWELIIMASLCYCPSVPTDYNHKNQGCMAEQSTAEEMKDAWVLVAIVHLIRTEVSIQSEQTQEVILIKQQRVQNMKVLYNSKQKSCKKKKKILRRIWVREAQIKKRTQGQKQKDKPLRQWLIVNTVVQRSAYM